MAAKKSTVSALKIKKKRWISVVAPQVFKGLQIGESHVVDPELLVGRQMKVNLMSLTNDLKKQNLYVDLRISEVKNASAQTAVIGYGMTPASTKRIVRRNRDKLDDSFICETANNIMIRVKPLMLTRNKARGGTTSALIKANREKLAQYIKKLNYDSFVQEIIFTKLQRVMKEQLSKVYPIRIYEIRSFKIVNGKIKPGSVVKAVADKVQKKDSAKDEDVQQNMEIEEEFKKE